SPEENLSISVPDLPALFLSLHFPALLHTAIPPAELFRQNSKSGKIPRLLPHGSLREKTRSAFPWSPPAGKCPDVPPKQRYPKNILHQKTAIQPHRRGTDCHKFPEPA